MLFELDSLKKNRFVVFDDFGGKENLLDNAFLAIEKEWQSPSAKISRSILENYTVYDGPSLPNVLYTHHLTDNDILDIKTFLEDTGIKNSIETLWGSNIGVCNVRAYRFTSCPPKEKTHYKDNLDEHNMSFNAHKDGLVNPSLKMMIYKNPEGEDITLEHGTIEVYVDNRWESAIGRSPLGVIFHSNLVVHRALQPAKDNVRDCIEITFIKTKVNNFPVVQAGAHAGHPIDQDKWEKDNS